MKWLSYGVYYAAYQTYDHCRVTLNKGALKWAHRIIKRNIKMLCYRLQFCSKLFPAFWEKMEYREQMRGIFFLFIFSIINVITDLHYNVQIY